MIIIEAPLHKQRVRINKWLKAHKSIDYRYSRGTYFISIPRKDPDRSKFMRWIRKQMEYGDETEMIGQYQSVPMALEVYGAVWLNRINIEELEP